MSIINQNPNTNSLDSFGDLESQQYEKLYNSYDVPLLDIRKSYFKYFFFVGIVILAMVLFLSFWLKIPNYLKVPVQIDNKINDLVMDFNHSVKVNKFYIQTGDTVILGQELCMIASPEIQQLIYEIKNAESQLLLLLEVDSMDLDVKRKNVLKQIKNKEDLYKDIEEEIKTTQNYFNAKINSTRSELNYLLSLEADNKVLLDSNIISKFDYQKIKQDYLNKANELEAINIEFDQQINQLQFRSTQIRGELVQFKNNETELKFSFTSKKSKVLEQIKLANDRLKLYYGDFKLLNGNLILLAPKAGVIVFKYPNNKILEKGEVLYKLQNNGGGFEGLCTIDAEKVGYLKENLEAKILLKTFPHYEWGNLTGVLKAISQSPNEKGIYSFVIEIITISPSINPLLQNGQTGDGYILIEELTLRQYLSRSFNKTKDSILN